MFISLYHTVPVNARGSITESRNCVKSLGIYTDSNFAFGNHLNRICCKASQKLHALSRFVKYISDEKRMFRSSYQKCSIKKGVLRNFAKFTGKYLCQSLFVIKLQASFFHRTPLVVASGLNMISRFKVLQDSVTSCFPDLVTLNFIRR